MGNGSRNNKNNNHNHKSGTTRSRRKEYPKDKTWNDLFDIDEKNGFMNTQENMTEKDRIREGENVLASLMHRRTTITAKRKRGGETHPDNVRGLK